MLVLHCKACGAPTDNGPKVAGKMRPLCEGCWPHWPTSGECDRYSGMRGLPLADDARAFARAFTDWLTRVRAERRNGVAT